MARALGKEFVKICFLGVIENSSKQGLLIRFCSENGGFKAGVFCNYPRQYGSLHVLSSCVPCGHWLRVAIVEQLTHVK